jgi:hypothetical protein
LRVNKVHNDDRSSTPTRTGHLWLAAILFPLIFAACADLPSAPPATPGDKLADCRWLTDGSVYCDPVQPIWDGPPPCDPYLTLGGCDDNCEMSEPGMGDPEHAALAGCNDTGTGPGTGDPTDPGGGGAPPPPADDPNEPCDPAIHANCETPLTAQDTMTINDVLANLLRPAAQFTDSLARAECAQLRSAFERALSEGKVFRGAFDSDTTNARTARIGGCTAPVEASTSIQFC